MTKMAKRYYFDIEAPGGLIQDEEGVEAFSEEQALRDARSVVLEMIDQLDEVGLSSDSILAVRDETGAMVGRIAFRGLQDRVKNSSSSELSRRRKSIN